MAKRAETKNKKKTVKQPKAQAKGAKGRKARRDSKKTAKAESKGTIIFIGTPKLAFTYCSHISEKIETRTDYLCFIGLKN